MVEVFGRLTDHRGLFFVLCWKVVEYVAREGGRVLSGRLFHL